MRLNYEPASEPLHILWRETVPSRRRVRRLCLAACLANTSPPGGLIYQANGSNSKSMAPTCAHSSKRVSRKGRACHSCTCAGIVNLIRSSESATFRGGGGHFCGRVARLVTSQDLLHLPPRAGIVNLCQRCIALGIQPHVG